VFELLVANEQRIYGLAAAKLQKYLTKTKKNTPTMVVEV
jgi:hypothetical protein